MTTPVVPVNVINWPTLSIPADGEAVSSASVLLYIQEIANRLESLRQRLPGANPAANRLSRPYSLSFQCPSPAAAWTPFILTSGNITYVNATLAGTVIVPLSPILNCANGQIIRSMNGLYAGVGSHSALPAVMPKMELVKCARGVGSLPTSSPPAFTVIESTTDTSPNVAAFQNVHFLSKDLVTPELYDNSQDYYLRFTAESGANALIGAFIIDNGYIEVSAP